MALFRVYLVAVLVVVAVLRPAEATLKGRQRCHPQVKYVTEYVTELKQVQVPVEKTVYRTQVKTQVQQQYVTVTKTQQSYRTVCPKQQPSYGYGGR